MTRNIPTGMELAVMPAAMPVSNLPRRSNNHSFAAAIMRNPAIEGITDIIILCFLPTLSFIPVAINPPTIVPTAKIDYSTNRNRIEIQSDLFNTCMRISFWLDVELKPGDKH